jgi:cysteine desulfurase
MKLPVYLDYAASTPVDSRVADAMSACLHDPGGHGNPSATLHAFGRDAGGKVTRARSQVAALINASPDEIVWTSSATESDNLAIIGAARFRAAGGPGGGPGGGSGRGHIVTAVTEHPAVLDSCRYLERENFHVTYLRPDAHGIVDPETVRAALTPETILVSIMHVNNEIGVIQDIAAIGAICRAAKILFHVDAAQSAGKLPIDVRAQAIDLMSLSAHKTYGPKGIAALFLDEQRIGRIEPLFYGGGQERGLRPGTIPTHQVVGMGEAYKIAAEFCEREAKHTATMRDRLWHGIEPIPGVLLNGHPTRRAGHILSVSVTGVEGESLHYALRNLAVSAGSACATASTEPSGVLRAIGRSDELARSTVRFSFGRETTAEEIDFAIDCFNQAVKHLRGIVPSGRTALA